MNATMSTNTERTMAGVSQMSTRTLESADLNYRYRFDEGYLTENEKKMWRMVRDELRNRL